MADTDNATRAPESDAHESFSASPPTTTPHSDRPPPSTAQDIPSQPQFTLSNMLANDTPAQTGPTMGEHCTTDRPLPSSQKPTGEITEIGGVQTYISRPQSYPHNPGKLLLLLTGGTGIASPNNQLQADAFAARGYVVIMPDQFRGDAAPNTSVSEADAQAAATAQSPSILERIKLGAAETAKSFLIDMWLARHTAEKVLPILGKVLEAAREEFADAVANGSGVYGAGYCFGAKYILQLCASQKVPQGDEESAPSDKAPELKCGVIAHGTLITAEDIEGVKAPVAMACVQDDNLFPNDVREQGKAALELNGVEHEVKVYEDVPHGFAVVGDYRDETIKKAQEGAFDFMAAWLESR